MLQKSVFTKKSQTIKIVSIPIVNDKYQCIVTVYFNENDLIKYNVLNIRLEPDSYRPKLWQKSDITFELKNNFSTWFQLPFIRDDKKYSIKHFCHYGKNNFSFDELESFLNTLNSVFSVDAQNIKSYSDIILFSKDNSLILQYSLMTIESLRNKKLLKKLALEKSSKNNHKDQHKDQHNYNIIFNNYILYMLYQTF